MNPAQSLVPASLCLRGNVSGAGTSSSLAQKCSAELWPKDFHVQAAVSDNLLDRLEDCRGVFPTVAVVGGPCASIVKRLIPSQRCPSQLLVLDESAAMLQHTRRLGQQQVRLLYRSDQTLAIIRPSVH